MSVNIGLVGIASVNTAGNQQVATAPSGANIANSAIRVFDFALVGTGGNVTFYAGTTSSGTALIQLNGSLMNIHSDVGYRFAGGVYASVGATIGGATITYMTEF